MKKYAIYKRKHLKQNKKRGMWSTTRNAQKNPKEVIEIMNSMKKGYALVKDSKVSANVSNDHEINRRYDEPREGVCPNKRVLKGVCPSMTTHKD